MQYRTFGRAGWQVSEIGFGAWGIGGGWGPVDDKASIDTLHYAWDQGINFVDTAQMYGTGHSEEVIAEALRQWSGGRIYVATKIQPCRWPAPAEDSPMMRGRYPAWYLRQEVEGCLARLGLERLDLLQLHCWIPAGAVELDWLETLNALRLEGKIDRIGLSIRDNRPEDGVEAARLGLADAQQVVFNMFDQRPADALFRAGEPTGTAFIARVPLDSGSLTGRWDEATYATWDETMVPFHLFRGERFAEALGRIRALKAETDRFYPDAMAEAALRYTLSYPAVAVVIPGMRNRKEVDMNIAVSDGRPFPAELLEAIRPHRWARNFYQ